MLYCIVIGEEWVCVDVCVLDGVMNENDKTTPARGARAVTTDDIVVREWGKVRV